jgi:hypothetical protein
MYKDSTAAIAFIRGLYAAIQRLRVGEHQGAHL